MHQKLGQLEISHSSAAHWPGFRSLQTYGFRYYFIGLAGLLFTFPSRYLFTIDHQTYLALGDSAPCFPRSILSSGYSRLKTKSSSVFIYEAITRFGPAFQRIRLTNAKHKIAFVLSRAYKEFMCSEFVTLPQDHRISNPLRIYEFVYQHRFVIR